MAKGLIITEKPSVAKDIVKALGGFEEKQKGDYFESDEYICTYAVGHILTLFSPEDISPQFKRWRLADLPIIPEEFKTKPVPKQESRLKVISKLMLRKDVDRLINACDAAREGELIFREIVKHVGVEKPIYRLWLQSMTKKAIQDGFNKLENGEHYSGLAAAAECRANADWLIGMNATRALTVRLKSRNQRGMSWSAGRVQTPTLSLLVDREIEVLEHVPEPYWRIKGSFKVNEQVYEGLWFDPDFSRKESTRDQKEDRIFDKSQAEAIVQLVKGKEALAREVRKPSPRKPPPLFDLTSLQRTANSRFGWSASRTLKAAQRCYETHKVLTYPRTSSKFLPNDYRAEVDKILEIFADFEPFQPHAKHLLKNGLLNEDKVFNDAGVTDHFAIIPTGELKTLEGDDQKLFDLVSRQFMAAFYPPSIYEEVERITEVEGQNFRSKPPRVLKDPGWEAVFDKKVGDPSQSFPPLVVGKDKVDGVAVLNQEAEMEELETKPPSRISEAGLLSLMENAGRQVEDEELASALNSAEGLGTAATRAEIIENLKAREYVDANLRPTTKGIRLIDILHRTLAARLTSPELTAQLELHLNEVEQGKRTSDEFMKEVAEYTKEVVDATRDFDYEAIYPDNESLGDCPKCGRPVFERAWFYGCSESTKRAGKKNCDFLIWKDHNGRYINPQVVRTLLKEKMTRELDGFKSASGKPYTAILELDGGTLVRKNVSESEQVLGEGYEVNPEPLGPCPIDCKKDCVVVETSHEFICREKREAREQGEKNAPGFSFPRNICKREITRNEVLHYLQQGETELLTNFVSKRGRKFSAKLVMEKDGVGFRFEFPPRVPKKKASESGDENLDAEKASSTTPASDPA
ncbi:MAG: DNA topoisomerase [Oligoflexus sp.]